MPDDDASVPPQPPPPSPAVPPPSGVAGVGTGTVGQPRSSGLTILLFIVTCGIWGFLWNYWVFEENKKWSGEGIGGVVALVIWFFVAPVNFFILPHEVKQMYEADGPRKSRERDLGSVVPAPPHRPHHLAREGPGCAQRLLGIEGRGSRLMRATRRP